jgi:hypothetical protein
LARKKRPSTEAASFFTFNFCRLRDVFVGQFTKFFLRFGREAPGSTAPANRPYHLVDLRFFSVDGRIGAKQRPLHGMASAG